MNDIKTLVIMQLKDKLDLGFIKDKAQLIRKIVFFVLRFAIVTALSYGLFYLSAFLRIFHNSPYIPASVMTVVMTIVLVFSTITCTNDLIKALYNSPDNQVLITYPISANKVFLSKIIVFYINEIYRSFSFTVPLFFAYSFLAPTHWFFYIWVFFAFFVISLIPVVLGVVLSIPGLYISRFLSRHRVIKIIIFAAILSLSIYLLVRVILLIPDEINVIHYWGPIKTLLSDIMSFFHKYFLPVYYVVALVLGEYDITMKYTYASIDVWAIFGCLLLILSILFLSIYFLSRFIFVKMASASFEYEKKIKVKAFLNRRLPRFLSFVVKELRIIMRTGEFAYNFIATYVSIPLILLLINQVFASMDLISSGESVVQSFNILIILLPLLSSNSMIATMYSKEGRTAYLKRAKPVLPIWPLTAKLIPNILLSLVCLGVSLFIFNSYMNYVAINIIFLTISLAFIQIGHILFCALFDLMNPQNEQYATTGEHVNNPNDIKATVLAFATSFLFALITMAFLFEEKTMPDVSFDLTFVKMLAISIAYVGTAIYLYREQITAYYYERIG